MRTSATALACATIAAAVALSGCGARFEPMTSQPTPAPPGQPVAQAPAPAVSPPGVAVSPSPAAPLPTPLAQVTPMPTPRPKPPRGPQPPKAAATIVSVAQQLVAVERTIRSPKVSEAELAQAAHLQQVIYRQMTRRPRWDKALFARIPAGLHHAVRANLRAARELDALSGPPPKKLPTWRIVAPDPAAALVGYYQESEAEFGIPWQYLAAIHLVETRMGRIRGTSTAGAQGPMQFIPSTWARYGQGNIRNNRDAILAAGRYLRARGGPRDMDAALFSYNNSNHYVRAVDSYARVMLREPVAYRGYYHWQVYFNQPGGPVLLPVGYDGRRGSR